jgi:hypothetical protein
MNPTTVGLSVFLFALLCFHGLFHLLYRAPAASTSSSSSSSSATSDASLTGWHADAMCNDHNPCTRDLSNGQGQCKHLPAPRTQACAHPHYRNGTVQHCDQGGVCTGHVRDCLGTGCTIDDECTGLFHWRTDVTMINEDFELRPLDRFAHCYAGTCRAHAVVVAVTSVKQTAEWWTSMTGPHLAQDAVPCESFLAGPVHKDLLVRHEQLDAALSDPYSEGITRWGLPRYPVQLSVCHYQTSCSLGHVQQSPASTPS